MPKISILMGIYNVEEYLNDSIDSIFEQTYTDWELILCDDGSKDRTYEIAREYKESYPDRIVLLKNDNNKGLNYTLNRCLSVAQGEYIARQDGDDRSLPNRLKKEIQFLEQNQEYSLVGSNMLFFDENGVWGGSDFSGEVKLTDFASHSPFMHPTVLIRREAIASVGGYSEGDNLIRVEDYHLWYKLYLNGYKGFNLNEALYEYRDDRNAFAKRSIKNRINLFRVMEKAVADFKLPLKYKIIPLKQIVLIIIPKSVYAVIHKRKYRK